MLLFAVFFSHLLVFTEQFSLHNVTTINKETLAVRKLRILMFSPKVGLSHLKFMARVADTLIDAGHHVSILSPDGHPDFKEVFTDRAEVLHVDYGVSLDMSLLNKIVWEDNGLIEYLRLLNSFQHTFTELCRQIFLRSDVIDWIREQNFDIAISEFFMCFDSVALNAGIKKSVTITSTNPIEFLTEALGVLNSPAFVPGNAASLSNRMTLCERMQNFFSITIETLFIRFLMVAKCDSFGKELMAKDYIPIEEAASRHSFIFVNNDELLDFPRPLTSKWVYIGGLRLPSPAPLKTEWETILGKRKEVIIVSLGTNIRSKDMPLRIKNCFIEAFQRFPEIAFVWKYEDETDEIFKNQTNVIAKAWIPQADLLSDVRVIAFISHAGMGSVFEAAFAGKPMITLPLMADQLRNSEMMKTRGVSVDLHKASITVENVVEAIKEIRKPEYSEKARKLAEMLKAKPFSPAQKLVETVEFAANYDVEPLLASPSAQMSFVQLYLLDIILPIAFLPVILVYSYLYVFGKCYTIK